MAVKTVTKKSVTVVAKKAAAKKAPSARSSKNLERSRSAPKQVANDKPINERGSVGTERFGNSKSKFFGNSKSKYFGSLHNKETKNV